MKCEARPAEAGEEEPSFASEGAHAELKRPRACEGRDAETGGGVGLDGSLGAELWASHLDVLGELGQHAQQLGLVRLGDSCAAREGRDHASHGFGNPVNREAGLRLRQHIDAELGALRLDQNADVSCLLFGLDATSPAHHFDGHLPAHSVEDARVADQHLIGFRGELALSGDRLGAAIEDALVLQRQGLPMGVELGERQSLLRNAAASAADLLKGRTRESAVGHVEVKGRPVLAGCDFSDRFGDAIEGFQGFFPFGFG